METVDEGKMENEAVVVEKRAVTTYVREVTVNYRGPRRERVTVKQASCVVGFIKKVLPDNSREHLIAVFLDAMHQVIGYSVAATGTANACPVHPREIYQRAILIGSTAVIIGHNHPTGQTSPSAEDFRVTKTLKEAGALIGIPLLDHVIVGEATFYSFSEHGTL